MSQLTLELKPIEDILEYRWITISEQKEFSDFLESFGVPSEDIRNCANTWRKYQCAVNPKGSCPKKVQYNQCGHRGKCPRDSMSYAHHRASIAYHWLKQNIADRLDFDLKLNQIELTLPKDIEDMDTKLFTRMLRDFCLCFRLGAYGYSVHTRRSSNPLGSKRVHGHILSFNFDIDEKLTKNEYFHDVELMRETWKLIIETNTDSKPDEVDIHTAYSSVIHDKEKVIHKLAYLYRYPIQDLFNAQVRTHTVNYFKTSQFKNSVYELLNEKKPRLIWCGWLSSSKRAKLQKLISDIGYTWQTFKDIERDLKILSDTCPNCKSPYEKNPCECGVYEGNNEPRIEPG